MSWDKSLLTHIWIFSVGRGLAAFIRTALNQGIIVDAGSSDDFDTAAFIKNKFVEKLDDYIVDGKNGEEKSKITQVVLSHPHEDHITYCKEFLKKPLYPNLITCPHCRDKTSDKTSDNPVDEKFNWEHIDEPNDEIHSTYKELYEHRALPLQTILFKSKRTIPNLEYGLFYLPPPKVEEIHGTDDGKYVNATSIMVFLRHGNHTVLFPGDMTPEVMEKILADDKHVQKRYTVFDLESSNNNPDWHLKTGNQPSLGSLLQQHGLTILVAPHHGLESCFSEKLFQYIKGGKPSLTVISDRRNKKDAKGEVDSRYDSPKYSMGMNVEIEGVMTTKYAVYTKDGHHFLTSFSGAGISKAFMNKDAETLLSKLN